MSIQCPTSFKIIFFVWPLAAIFDPIDSQPLLYSWRLWPHGKRLDPAIASVVKINLSFRVRRMWLGIVWFGIYHVVEIIVRIVAIAKHVIYDLVCVITRDILRNIEGWEFILPSHTIMHGFRHSHGVQRHYCRLVLLLLLPFLRGVRRREDGNCRLERAVSWISRICLHFGFTATHIQKKQFIFFCLQFAEKPPNLAKFPWLPKYFWWQYSSFFFVNWSRKIR